MEDHVPEMLEDWRNLGDKSEDSAERCHAIENVVNRKFCNLKPFAALEMHKMKLNHIFSLQQSLLFEAMSCRSLIEYTVVLSH
jgi:hypothetical protein